MPFKSKAQSRFFFAAEAKGELPKGTAMEWAHATPSIKKLPEKVTKGKKAAKARNGSLVRTLIEEGEILAKAAILKTPPVTAKLRPMAKPAPTPANNLPAINTKGTQASSTTPTTYAPMLPSVSTNRTLPSVAKTAQDEENDRVDYRHHHAWGAILGREATQELEKANGAGKREEGQGGGVGSPQTSVDVDSAPNTDSHSDQRYYPDVAYKCSGTVLERAPFASARLQPPL